MPPCSTVSSRRESPCNSLQFDGHRSPSPPFALIVAVAPVVRAQQPCDRQRPVASRCNPPISRRGRASANRCCRTTANGSPTSSRLTRATRRSSSARRAPTRKKRSSRSAIRRRGGGRGGAAGGAAASSLSISGDSRWVAFTIYPAAATGAGRGGRGGRGGGGGGGAAAQGATAGGAGAEQDGARQSRHRREEGIRQGSTLRVQRRQADVDRDAELPGAGGADAWRAGGGAAGRGAAGGGGAARRSRRRHRSRSLQSRRRATR